MADDEDKGAKPALNAVGQPEPKPGQPVDPYQPGQPEGERQDGPGASLPRPERTEATPVGSTAARRAGANAGQPEEPDAAHRGQPAGFVSGAARGSGSGAGEVEEPDPDSAGGGGRGPGYAAARAAPASKDERRKPGG